MTLFDVFNGDADGICSLQQLRLAEPAESILVTGIKRDISLLKRVKATQGDQVNVLDISLDKNREPLEQLLAQGIKVRYFDHHFPGDIPEGEGFEAYINTAPDKGTSLLVDQYLNGKHRAWAVVGTFGDNFDASASEAAQPLGLNADQLNQLKQLGIYINYNGYGAAVEDLHFAPDLLYKRLHPYTDPLEFIASDESFGQLEAGYHDDMRSAQELKPVLETEAHGIYMLPDEPWARRVSGVFANQLAQSTPNRAHAMLTQKADGDYLVSVRAPLSTKTGADDLCRQFPTGGGRKAAAGINSLPADMYEEFERQFMQAF